MNFAAASSLENEAAVIRKVSGRLLPFLFVLYVVAYLDRVNVGFAALQMKSALHFSDPVYGLGAGMFFAGYLFFQIPSNIVLVKFGARRWISVLMIAWGLISSSMMFVHTPTGFYVLRFLLGAAEAGFFPGIVFYLTSWFPVNVRARSVSWFLMGMPLAGVIGGPLAGALLSLQGTRGLAGWQWLFLLEGIPAIVLGAAVRFVLTEKPQDASWLTREERASLLTAMDREGKVNTLPRGNFFTDIFFRGEVWLLCGAYFTLSWSSYGLSLWLPEVVKNFSGFSNWGTGLISAIPYAVAMAAMILVAARSDRTRKPHLHFACAAFIGAAAFALSTQIHNVALSTICLSLTVAGIYAAYGPFWAMPGEILSGTTAAAGIAFINSLGNFGGLFGPYFTGKAKEYTGTFTAASLILGGVLLLGGCFALLAKVSRAPGQLAK
jgi:ACS family tartrate transporter-like MFS transporter